MQKLLTYIIAAAIIYTLMNTKFDQIRQEQPAPSAPSVPQPEAVNSAQDPQLEGNFLEKSLSTLLINVLKTNEGRTFFENLIQPINKPLSGDGMGFKLDNLKLVEGMFKIKTYGEGKVGPASCGHIVSVNYQLTTLSNALVEEGEKTFSLGSDKAMLGMSDIIVGMYVGQSREGFIPQKYASPSKNPSTAYKLKVTLRSITPNLYANPAEIKIFDDEIAYSMPCLCGDRVAFDVNIKRINGEVMYDSVKVGRKVSMQLGDLAYPMLFSYALFNKVPGGMRTVLSQGKYLRSLAVSNINRIFQKDQLPKDEFFIVEFSNISM